MQNIQEIFDQLEETKKQQKEIKEEYKDALNNTEEYEEIKEQIKELTERRKQIETNVQNQLGQRFEQLEELKGKQKELKQMLSDIAMNNLINGESIEVKDNYNTLYEPQINVTFKKTSAKKEEVNEKKQQ
jgi:Tfp pilus assembly protein PilO